MLHVLSVLISCVVLPANVAVVRYAVPARVVYGWSRRMTMTATGLAMLPDVAYYDARRSGDMLSKISADTVIISKAFFECSAAARSAISAVGGTGLLLYISPPLTALSLSVMPVVGVGAVLYGRYV